MTVSDEQIKQLLSSLAILQKRIKHLEMALSDRDTEVREQYARITELEAQLLDERKARIGELEKRLEALEADYINRQGAGR